MDGEKNDEVIDLVTVAREVGVSYSRLWSRAVSGQIPAVRTATGWRVRRADLADIRERLVGGTQPPKEGR